MHPGIVPDVQLEDRIGNWVEDRVDVGFRLGPSPDEGVIARRLFPAQLIICASPDYVRRNGAPKSLAELQTHPCSVFRHPATGAVVPWRVKVSDGVAEQPVQAALFTNDELMELQAVLDGRVIAQVAAATAARYIRAGLLMPLLADHALERSSYFVYFGSRTSQPARARAFVDLALQRLVGNTDYVLTMKELRGNKQSPAKTPG